MTGGGCDNGALKQRAPSAEPLDEAAGVCVLIHVGVAPQASTLLQSVLGIPPLAVLIACPANTRAVLVLRHAVTARLVSSQQTLVPLCHSISFCIFVVLLLLLLYYCFTALYY